MATRDKNLLALIEAARALDDICTRREERTAKLLAIAAEARRTGQPQTHISVPEPFEIGNEVAAVRRAIKRIRGHS